ncbi:hypothetical protein B6D60_03650 [candidate division KSB1 bacterium 4484_87]|nr:MAG: hypothetical protein B6D60_03650 [candidate division KSB1 bacterium 4484_87]
MVQHPKLGEWQKKLQQLINVVDDYLEDKYKGRYRLHPARPRRGKTSSKTQDGLFSITASFSLGYGSKFGRGYVVDVHLATLDDVEKERIAEIEEEAFKILKEKLPEYFPEREITVERDGKLIKIVGDLSLGEV